MVLLQMGGPQDLAGVRPFLYNLFSDPEIIPFPGPAIFQKVFAGFVSFFRGFRTKSNYQKIGGGSPILEITARQSRGLQQLLGGDWEAFVCMRYSPPRSEEVVSLLKEKGVEKAVLLSLYPQFSRTTTGSSLSDFERARKKIYPSLQTAQVREFHAHPAYIEALVEKVREGLSEFKGGSHVHLLFSAHGLPQKIIDEGDPYLYQVKETVRLVMESLGDYPFTLAFQSRAGPVKWLEPSTEAEIRRLAELGAENLLVIPVSFVSDHIETLFEIDIEYRELARKVGIKRFARSPSLNDSEGFLQALKEIVLEKAEEPGTQKLN